MARDGCSSRGNGLISIIENGEVRPEPFLDIRSKTYVGLAFSPSFALNGEYYITYVTRPGAGSTIVARYQVPPGQAVADEGSEEIILRLDHPNEIHYGGTLRFGPDGFLYIGLGDGGSALDEDGNAQNLDSLFGKILRIDVESLRKPYGIPASNPFLATPGARPEIWAYGLRNPWKFSFDTLYGDLYIGDVGQSDQEEIDFQPASSPGGENYGWNIMEGSQCAIGPCETPGLTAPIHTYGRDDGGSVTGGLVYRGSAIPSLVGTYVYGDFVSSLVRSGASPIPMASGGTGCCTAPISRSAHSGKTNPANSTRRTTKTASSSGSIRRGAMSPGERPPFRENANSYRLANRSRISPSSFASADGGGGGGGGGAGSSRFSRFICFTIMKITKARIRKFTTIVTKFPYANKLAPAFLASARVP